MLHAGVHGSGGDRDAWMGCVVGGADGGARRAQANCLKNTASEAPT
jgi:hypothetical protein